MIAGVPGATVVVIGAIVLLAAFVQSSVGLGLGMVGMPLVALVEPTLVPTLLLLLMIPVALGVWLPERRHVNWRVLAWSLPPRIPGTILGVWLVATFSNRVLGIGIGLVVLVAVWLALRAVEVPLTPTHLVAAGLAAGVTGTAAAIDGPPLAVVVAHRPPQEVRATMAVFFVLGAGFSVAGFWVQDALPWSSVVLSAVLLPVVLVAVPLGGWASRRVPRETFRRGVLVICASSAVVLLGKSLLGV